MRHDLGRPIQRKPAAAVTFTVKAESWDVPLGQLEAPLGQRYRTALRGHLERSIAALPKRPDGMLFACLHGAFDPATNTFPLHFHGVATGEMIDAVDGLRKLPKYAPARPHDGRDAANTPVVISRAPLTNMPDPLTYTMKRWWPLRETYLDKDGLRKAYGGGIKAITGAAEAEYLMFLDQHRLEDITLLMGMHVTKSGLVTRCRD